MRIQNLSFQNQNYIFVGYENTSLFRHPFIANFSPAGINLREQGVYDVFQKVVDAALEIQPDLILHSRDFFHRPSPADSPVI